MKEINIGLIGHRFMGKAHTHAYTDLPIFFDTDLKINKKILCANDNDVKYYAKKWGWDNWTMDWHDVIEREDINLVDIAASNEIHAEIVIAAALAGKHIFCEKPLALSLDSAKKMVKIVKDNGVVNMIGFNCRRVPAIAFAKQLIDQGRLGEIYHFRGCYQQSWLVDPNFPLVWRLEKEHAGYGSLGDHGAHVIDLGLYLIGEIDEVIGFQKTFIAERPLAESSSGIYAKSSEGFGKVDVDDATNFLAKFKNKKTMGYFEMTRFGTGHRNQNRIEINGSKGSVIFDMEKMNELLFYDETDQKELQGFKKIQVGENVHPYMANWWPAGHLIGYGDTFVNQAYDLIMAIKNGHMVKPDFEDGLICQRVLEKVNRSAQSGKWEKI